MKLLIGLAVAVLMACGVYTPQEPTPARSDLSRVASRRPVTNTAIWSNREQVPLAYRHTVNYAAWTGEPILAVFSDSYVCTFVFNGGAPDAHRGQLLNCPWQSPRGYRSPAMQQDEPRHVMKFNAALLRQWSLMFREFDSEFLQCVYAYSVPGDTDENGAMINDTVKVAFAINANLPPSHFHRDSVRIPNAWPEEICAPVIGNYFVLLADVHNHIPRVIDGVRHVYCYPSQQDIGSSFGRQGVPVAFILCDDNRFVYFTEQGLVGGCSWNPETPNNMQLVCKREGS